MGCSPPDRNCDPSTRNHHGTGYKRASYQSRSCSHKHRIDRYSCLRMKHQSRPGKMYNVVVLPHMSCNKLSYFHKGYKWHYRGQSQSYMRYNWFDLPHRLHMKRNYNFHNCLCRQQRQILTCRKHTHLYHLGTSDTGSLCTGHRHLNRVHIRPHTECRLCSCLCILDSEPSRECRFCRLRSAPSPQSICRLFPPGRTQIHILGRLWMVIAGRSDNQ